MVKRGAVVLIALFLASLCSAQELDRFNRALTDATRAMNNEAILARF